MKEAIKRILTRLPGGERLLHARRRRIFLRRFGGKGVEELFTHYYDTNEWGNAESVSGPGSTAANTEAIRQALPGLIESRGVRRILDAPCGDFNWFRLVKLPAGVEYIGADIVGPLIDRNQETFGGEAVRFTQLDILSEPLPNADLWLCRDCLFHFSYADVRRALDNLLRSNIPRLLTTTYPDRKRNIDIVTGGFHPLNLRLPPFSFGEPELTIDEAIEGEPDRKLALWRRDQLRAALDEGLA